MTVPCDARGDAAQVRSADKWISHAAAATVAGPAGVAGALSYSHMRQLAQDHGQAGWHAHAFPPSVDDVEIVASLVLLADRRAGRWSGWLPWAALAIGTAGSIAANIATAHADPVSRIIAGWPAVALLIAIKLLSGILEHRTASSDPASEFVPARSSQPAPRSHATARTGGTRLADATKPPARQPAALPGQPRHQPAPNLTPPAAALLPAARQAADHLTREGQLITRDALAARLRRAGNPVRNATLTPLLRHLRQEQHHPAT